MEKILTIVIPTYNMERYLEKCLTSLIIDDQDLMNQVEVLIVNDGSKDRSSEIAHSYQDKYSNTFRVIDKENGNYGSCVNRGLSEATGKYIKILDADDSFFKDGYVAYINKLLTIDFVKGSCFNSFFTFSNIISCLIINFGIVFTNIYTYYKH